MNLPPFNPSPAAQAGDWSEKFVTAISNCEREPIHIPGSIQAHGALIAFEIASGAIVHASTNLDRWLPVGGLPINGRLVKGIVGAEGYEMIKRALSVHVAGPVRHQIVPLRARPQEGQPLDLEALVHTHRNVCYAEIEPVAASAEPDDLAQGLSDTINALRIATDMDDLVQRMASQVKRITRMDRVMVYQFDELNNGRVTADVREPGMESFFDLHYPASDIPAQARALYLKNLVRYIPDVGYEPVQVRPWLNTSTMQPLDMSYAALRSISPMHIQYLSNMGVRSTLTLSLIVDGRLWGLIACHHNTPTACSLGLRRACHALAMTAGYMTGWFLAQAEKAETARRAKAQETIVEAFNHVQASLPDVVEEAASALKQLAGAVGGALWHGGQIIPFGQWPEGHRGISILQWIRRGFEASQASSIFLDRLDLQPPLSPEEKRILCGLAAIKFDGFVPAGIVWVRGEHRHEVSWGGDPDKPMDQLLDANGQLVMSPRASFAKWRQQVNGLSMPWTAADRAAIESLGVLRQVLVVRESLAQISLSDRKFRSLIELTAEGYWETETNGYVSILSKPLPFIHKAIEQTTLSDLFAEACEASDVNMLRQALAERRPFRRLQMSGRRDHTSKRKFMLEISGEPTYFADGEFSGWQGALTNVTDRMEAEVALREKAVMETLLQRVGKIVQVGGWWIDLASEMVHWSEATRTIHEVDVTYVPSVETGWTFFPPEARSSLREAFRRARTDGIPWDLELPFVTAKGRPRWVRVVGEVEFEGEDHRRKAVGLIGALQDITVRYEAARVLREAKLAAELANTAKSAFLSNMSHEIRTPLNAMIGVAHLLAASDLNPDQKQLVSKAQIAGRSLLDIVNDVLDLAKIESGEMVLEDVVFQPSALLEELQALYGPQAISKTLVFEFQVASEVPAWLLGDSGRLRQMLTNLIGNALKFTHQGGIYVRLSVVNNSGQGVRLRVSVQDTGIGIAAEVQDHLFQPFTQADVSTTRRFGGTGLGLSIVRRIAQLMNGEAGLKSALGQGSEFWIEVPMALPSEDQITLADSDKLDVVVADESEQDRAAWVAVTESLGWRVTVLASSFEVLQLIERRAERQEPLPDALIVQGQKLGAQGLQVLEVLASRIELGRLAVVTFAEREAVVEQAPVTQEILVKPVLAYQLFNAVNRGIAQIHGRTDKVMRSTQIDASLGTWLLDMRVLLVDDSDTNLDVAARLLERQGAVVAICRNGQEALQTLGTSGIDFDVVLMDVQMPLMDGLEATRRVRGELGLTDLPIVALTAGAMTEERHRALTAGVNEFLSKPIEPMHMVRTLRMVVENRRGRTLPIAPPRRPHVSDQVREWPKMVGIDEATAALHLSGDWLLFVSSVQRLLVEFRDLMTPQLIEPESARRSELAEHAHKLRGSAGTLGATDVHRHASFAETSLRSPNALALPALQALAQALRALEAGATPLLATVAAERADSRLSGLASPLTLEQHAEMAELLRQSDLAAMDCFNRLRPHFKTSLGPSSDGQFESAMYGLDFSLALSLLEAASKEA